ncbi:hypothetical protein ABW20_dc0109415 [Dactylellina cionopaga]|nr:hypothetical protein ABW20_dc0109415 [Dactylellina cionopaga]
MALKWDNLRQFLDLCKTGFTELVMVEPFLESPMEEWFQLLKYLRQECCNLQTFKAHLTDENAYENNIDPDCMDYMEFLLPDLDASKDRFSGDLLCKVTLPTTDPGADADEVLWETTKNIGRNLDSNDQAKEFWDSLTDGMWRSEAVLCAVRGPTKTFGYMGDEGDGDTAISLPIAPSESTIPSSSDNDSDAGGSETGSI